MRYSIIVMLSALCVLRAFTARADDVDDYVRAQLAAQHIPGLSLAVMRDGKVIKTGGYGIANLELRTAATADTVYALCSVTKQFVAAGILLLERDGKLNIEDPVGKHLKFAPASWRPITLRNLLTMTSGIKDYINDPMAPGAESLDESRDFPKADTNAHEILQRVAAAPLNFVPGEKFSYSNTNYIALAHVITEVSGKPWHAFLAERIFARLGMKQTAYDDARAIVPNRAGRYDVIGTPSLREWRNSEWLNPTFWWQGGAGIISTVADMARWDSALRQGQIIGKQDLQRMRESPYAFGWNFDAYQGQGRMWHNGSIPGGSIHFGRFDDGKLSVVVMANTEANLDAIAIDVAGLLEPALAHPSLLISADSNSGDASSSISFEVRATNWGAPVEGLIAIEIRSSPYGRDDVVTKQSSDKLPFSFRKAVGHTFSWTPPGAGEYRIYVGIFSEDWAHLYAWQNGAGVLVAN